MAYSGGTGPRHALADEVGEGWVVSHEAAPRLLLTDVRADLFIAAAKTGRRVVTVTGEHTSMSEIFRDVMDQLGGRWAIRADAGYLYDGMSGRLLAEPKDAFFAGDPAAAAEVAPAFLQLEQAPETLVRYLASVRLKAAADTVVGRGVEALATLGGGAPEKWGRHEPVVHDWNLDNMTEFAQSRLPADTTLTVAGDPAHPLSGTVTVRRTEKGVEELSGGLVAIGPAHSEQARVAVASVPAAIGELTRFGMPLFAVLLAGLGTRDLALTPRLRPPFVPIALVIGAPAARQLGLDPTTQLDQFGATILGRPKIPGFSYPLADTGWSGLAAVLGQVPRASLLEATGPQLFALLAERGAVAPA